MEARRSPDEFDDVLKLGSGELGQHLIDTTLMTAAITVSDTLSAADQRTSRWMKNDSEAIRHGTGIYSGSRMATRLGLKYPANGLRGRKGSAYA
jgi:hypothetical protein